MDTVYIMHNSLTALIVDVVHCCVCHCVQVIMQFLLLEGVLRLWRGASLNITRGVLITVAQVRHLHSIKIND